MNTSGQTLPRTAGLGGWASDAQLSLWIRLLLLIVMLIIMLSAIPCAVF